jgi:hypothetical protein
MKARVNPRILVPGVPGFLLWARRDNPALYARLVAEFPEVAAFDGALQSQGLSGLADALKGAGAALASRAKTIASFVARVALPVASVAAPLIAAKKQADVDLAQMDLALAQQPPMQTALVPGQSPGWQMSVPISRSAPAFDLQGRVLGVPAWGWLAGAGALGLVLLARR